jgi:hypothetical protein
MMKKRISVALAILAIASAMAQSSDKTYSSGHYAFTYPESFSGIEETADAFNAEWAAFNGAFRFDPNARGAQNRVVILPAGDAYDAYVKSRVGESRNQFVFLKSTNPELSEIVLFPQGNASGYAAFAGPSLNRQLFLQFLYSYVAEPPVWMRDGFQAYFERLAYDVKAKKATLDGYSPWLETAKSSRADPALTIRTEELLSARTGSFESARLYPQAWAFVSFLLGSGDEGYRLFLREACLLLEREGNYNPAPQAANTEAVFSRFKRFNDLGKADGDFDLWLSHERTLNELVQIGVSAYNAGSFSEARQTLIKASTIRPDDPLVCYYLGLASYSEKDYKTAEIWYRKALEFGGEVSTVNWALGLNSYADGRYTESRVFLETAKSANPARYGKKVDDLVKSMPK